MQSRPSWMHFPVTDFPVILFLRTHGLRVDISARERFLAQHIENGRVRKFERPTPILLIPISLEPRARSHSADLAGGCFFSVSSASSVSNSS